ncbi:hypothetical protein OO17_05015 [Rhodopseudomonas palustris]|uniref:Leucine-binding protein domain-containing protein n=2 Tax=Nitrobacteraceae TaxID=41294 RepID=A0A0D7F2J5_RHOPL|nr:hypothetical protein OO17_05015 [Rhodopseudomonas palustris]
MAMSSTALCGAALAAETNIKIGVLLPLSGRYASAGQANKRGVDLVIQEVNRSGGIKALGGAKLDLVVADDASDQVTTAQEARRLIGQEQAKIVIGPYSTPEAEAAAPVAERAGVGVISTQASFDGLFERNYKYFTTVSMTSSQFGESYAEFVNWLNQNHSAGIKTTALTFPNNDYGKTASQAAVAVLKKSNIKVLETFGFPPKVGDMTPIVQRVKATDPNAVISIGYLQDGILLHQARVAQNYTSPPIWIGGSDAFSNDRMWQLLGDIAPKALSGKTFALAQFDNGVKTPGVEWLVSAATKAGFKDEEIDQGMAAGAQAAWLVVQALEDAKSSDPTKLAAAVHAVQLPADSPRVTMPQFENGVAYEASGKPKNPVALFVHWNEGHKTVIYPPNLATGSYAW